MSSGLSNSPSPSAPYARPAPSADATSLHTKRKRSPEDADTEADDAGTLGLTPSKRAMRARKPHAPAARPQAVEGSRQLAPLARQMSQHVDGVRAEDGVWTGRQRSSMAVLRQAHELYKARKGSPGALLKPQTEAALHRSVRPLHACHACMCRLHGCMLPLVSLCYVNSVEQTMFAQMCLITQDCMPGWNATDCVRALACLPKFAVSACRWHACPCHMSSGWP